MTNEAAERLRADLRTVPTHSGIVFRNWMALLDAALAAERKAGYIERANDEPYIADEARQATVERIRAEVGPEYDDAHQCQYRLDLAGVRAILEAEAAR